MGQMTKLANIKDIRAAQRICFTSDMVQSKDWVSLRDGLIETQKSSRMVSRNDVMYRLGPAAWCFFLPVNILLVIFKIKYSYIIVL